MRTTLFVLTAGLVLLPAGTRAADPPKAASDGREAEVEVLKRQIDALRTRLEALEKKLRLPDQEHHKIVVTSPLAKDVVITQQYVGKILAHRHINVSALMNGVVAEVSVKEGQAVKKGDMLFRVLPTIYQAKLDAELAEVQVAQIELDNTRKLFDQKVVSTQEVALHQAKLSKAKAKAKLAETELNFTVGRAPFDGIIGHLRAQEGSAVKEGDVLTTLADNSVMWVSFNVPEARYLEYMADKAQMKQMLPMELVLANGSKYPQAGKLGAIEGLIESDTGNIRFRADFPNPDRVLHHGQTGTVLVPRTLKNAIVIPQRATFEDRGKQYVYVVGKDDVAHRREITVQNETEDIFVVGAGLEVNDRIIVDGGRQVHDGEKVEYELRKPEEVIGGLKHHPE